MAKARAIVFTINNWTAKDVENVEELMKEAKYAVFGKEVGEQGTPHLQGYMAFESSRNFSALSKCLPRAHIEAAKGSAEQNRAYCSKGGDYKETGVLPRQGKRSDLDDVREQLAREPKMERVIEVARSLQGVKFAQEWLKYKEPKRKWKTEVYWFYGPTGSGKSRAANEMAPDAYRTMGTIKWWDGYDAHDDVIIDDMRRDFCKFHELLRLTDEYGFTVEVKGSSRQFVAKRIFITSCYSPDVMFETREDVAQLMRRINYIRRYQDDRSYVQEK